MRQRIWVSLLTRKYFLSRKIELTVVVTIRACPIQIPIYKRRHDLVEIMAGIGFIGVFAGDQVAIQHDELRIFLVEDAVHDAG